MRTPPDDTGAPPDRTAATPTEGSARAHDPSPGRSERERVRRPWWLPHFVGRVPVGLDGRSVSLVGVISLAGFFENYDLSMLTAAFKQIRESFVLSQAEMTSLIAWVRLGALPAFLVLPLADRFGRRRVFLASLLGMSVATFGTAFAQSAVQFVVLQTLTRTFVVASISTGVVIIAEELPAEHRGWGIGMLGAIGSLGFGLGAIFYAFVESLPFGWRSLYAFGAFPILLLPMLRRRVPETRRYTDERERLALGREAALESGAVPPTGVADWGRPMVELLRQSPGRSLAVGAMALLATAGLGPAFGLLSDFVQTTHGWSPGGYSLMAVVAGAFGIVGNSAMGWGADRFGRRPMGLLAFGLFPLVAFGIYLGPATGIPVLWVPLVFFLTGGNVLMRVITTELFPTSSRNTAMGWETLQETIGAAVGFALVGALTLDGRSVAPAIVWVSGLTVVAAAVLWMLPETARRELEATSAADD